MDSTYDRLAAVITVTLDVEPHEVHPERTFDEFGIDSLSLIELTLAVQKEFRIAIPDGDIDPANTIADTASMIENRKPQTRAS